MHLFAGAGGGLLADLILGHTPVVAVEWDRYCCQVLGERAADGWFPGLRVYEGDVRLFDPSEYAGRVDCIHAGFAAVTHIDFTEPFSAAQRARILKAAADCGEAMSDGAVYAATQGPRLETAAEIRRLERDGADIVGMTAMPEAALARELGLEYAMIAVVANHAAGRGTSEHGIALEQIEAVLAAAMGRVRRIVERLVVQ